MYVKDFGAPASTLKPTIASNGEPLRVSDRENREGLG